MRMTVISSNYISLADGNAVHKAKLRAHATPAARNPSTERSAGPITRRSVYQAGGITGQYAIIVGAFPPQPARAASIRLARHINRATVGGG